MCRVCDMSNERNSKDINPKDDITKTDKKATKSQCKEICDYRDLKLIDAEKTIANKEVIIRMLQDHQKKIEESLKQNLKETEYFRYKYRIALEQIKRFRAINKMNEKNSAKCVNEKCNKAVKPPPPKEPSESPSQICSCAQHLQTIETFMSVHYELVQNLMETKHNIPSGDNKEQDGQIALLQKEIDRLKDENAKLRDQAELLETNLIPKVRDSILETYKKSNKELLKKVSQMDPNVVCTEEEENLSEYVETTSAGKVSWIVKQSQDGLSHDPLEGGNTQNNRSSLKVIQADKKPSREGPERHASVFKEDVNVIEISSDEGSDEPYVFVQNYTEDDAKKEGPTVAPSADLNNMSVKLDDIRERVIEVLNQQTSTNKEIELLKSEMAISRDTTKECTENISKLKITIDEQKQTFEANFQENKAITDNLIQANDKIQQELLELKSKIQTLSENVDDVKNKQNENKESLTAVEDLAKNADVHAISDEEDSPIKRCLCEEPPNKLQKQCLCEDPEPTTEVMELATEEQETCSCGEFDIQTYIDKVHAENTKLRTTISSIIAELNEKMSEMKESKYLKPNNCLCVENVEQEESEVCKANAGAQVEIEDIYNSVRNTCIAKKTFESSTSCLGYKDESTVPASPPCCCSTLVLQQNVCQNPCCGSNIQYTPSNIEDIYASVLCMCRNGAYTSSATQPPHLVCEYFRCPSQHRSEAGESNEGPTCSEMEITVAEQCNSSEQCLFSSMENYVNYLYEQLKIISCIEGRIEALKGQVYPIVKESK